MGRRKTVWSDYLAAAGVAAAGVGIIGWPVELSQGIRDGLAICANVLIPSLFPFMALSGFLSLTSAARILSAPLAPITTRLFKLPKDLGAVVLMSLIGGYPVGAKNISLLLSKKRIGKETAERMLCFCVNSGPSFLITAVGAGMLMSRTAGIILFCSQTAATIIIGAVASHGTKTPGAGLEGAELRGAEAFVTAVSGASSAMLSMCSFAVLFSGLLSFISASGFVGAAARFLGIGEGLIRATVSGFFEVTSGCVNASQLGGEKAFALISAFVSFGGLSVLFQITACFRDEPIRFRPFILARLFHMPLSVALALPAYRYFCATRDVFAGSALPIAHTDGRTAFITACLLCMCAIMSMWGQGTGILPNPGKSYKMVKQQVFRKPSGKGRFWIEAGGRVDQAWTGKAGGDETGGRYRRISRQGWRGVCAREKRGGGIS